VFLPGSDKVATLEYSTLVIKALNPCFRLMVRPRFCV